MAWLGGYDIAGILGVAIRIDQGRYLAGFVHWEGAAVASSQSVAARAGARDEVTYEELYERSRELVRAHAPDLVALFQSETDQQPSKLRPASRAEGAVMAAAGSCGARVGVWSGQLFRSRAGVPGATRSQQIIIGICAKIGTKPRTEEEARALCVAYLGDPEES